MGDPPFREKAFDYGELYPSVLIGAKAHFNWSTMHTWCLTKFGESGYSWRGSMFYFANLEYLLEFCDVWMYEDEICNEKFF